MALELRVKNWRTYLPILDVARHYNGEDLHHDLVAGLVVGVVTIPQAVAYAFLAGLPPEAGLYACLAPMVIYALLGSSKQMVVGPVAVAALMVAAAVGKYAPAYSDAYLGITTVLCLQSGLILLLLRASNMGGLVNLLSQPVIVGFINAAAILIIISQIGPLTGIDGHDHSSPLGQLRSLWSNIGGLNAPTLLLGGGCAGLMWAMSRYSTRFLNLFGLDLPANHPITRLGPLVAASFAALAVWWGELDSGFGVTVIGAVPRGLPGFTLPPFELQLWQDLLPTSAMIALVAYVESFSIGSTIATRQRTRLNSNQELIALGAANIGAAFTGAYPVAGSFSRSSVNYHAGARTPVSSLICAVVIVATLLLFTPLFNLVPNAALAAIVIISVLGLMDLKGVWNHWKMYKHDSIAEIATLIGVLVFGVETGLIIGVALSIALFVRRTSKPHIALVGRIGESEHFRAANRYDVEEFLHVAAVRIDENLFFANANQVENKLLKVVQRRPGTRHVLLVCSAINMVDISGLEMLYRVNQSFERMGITLHLSEVKGPVMEQLESTDFIHTLTGSVFFTTDQAMRDLGQRD